ncbi:MAG: ferrous iron transport protein A [Clostridiales bacterium]|nr:ferrous iron transport protein A [Clostridiales bacterium]
MPLTMLRPGESGEIKKIGGREDTKQFLHKLGFVEGSSVTLISQLNGDLIVTVKDTRVAINREMANRILV